MFYASRLGALSFWQQLRLRADEVGVKGSLTLPGMTVWSLAFISLQDSLGDQNLPLHALQLRYTAP